MKKILTFLMLITFALGVSAQLSLINFESGSVISNWTSFANNPDAAGDIRIAENPDKSGINTSDSALLFMVNLTASQWMGAWSDNYGPIEITADAHTFTMMVYKDVVTNCDFKIEQSTNGGPDTEVKVPNTVTGQWELLTFDLSAAVGYSYARLTLFPDFPDARTEGSTCYLDNVIGTANVSVNQLSAKTIKVFPNPADERIIVQAPDMTGYTITNMIGQTIRMEKFQTVNSRSIEISDMPTGVYFITVESLTGTHTSKFMVR